jgi:hypothetical protein
MEIPCQRVYSCIFQNCSWLICITKFTLSRNLHRQNPSTCNLYITLPFFLLVHCKTCKMHASVQWILINHEWPKSGSFRPVCRHHTFDNTEQMIRLNREVNLPYSSMVGQNKNRPLFAWQICINASFYDIFFWVILAQMVAHG